MTAALPAPGEPAASGAHRFALNSRDLFSGRRKIVIPHAPLEHRPRILTK